MKLKDEDRQAFKLAGTVLWHPASQTLVWTWQPNVPSGCVVYLMLIDQDVMKCGIATDTAASTFQKRMQSEFSVARQVIAGPIPGKPLPGWRLRPLDPFKKNAPRYLLEGHVVELWAKACVTTEVMY